MGNSLQDVTPLAKPLTSRELEVLTLIADGLTNREIAEQLVIALSTVKWHVRQIYNKLGVHNRQEAIGRARNLDLIGTTDRQNTKLPPQSTSFYGRSREIGNLVALLENKANRLVSILGPGGIGKTRLAIEVARISAPSFKDGVFFVTLASLDDPLSIIPQIADVLGFPFHVRDQRENWEYDSEKEQLLAHLSDKQLLIILDNAEHLLSSSLPSIADWKQDIGQLVAEIINYAPYVQLLATSHQRLNLLGENVYPIDGLTIPNPPQNHHPVANQRHLEWRDYDSVQLFIDGATRARPDFAITNDNIMGVIEICHLVDGLPLGIELATAWLSILSPDEIADEIQTNLDFLASKAMDIPDRQRSLRSVFESSWRHLDDDEQYAFLLLSIFRGGFTREVAQQVIGVSLAVLLSLVNKSLIRPDFRGRYHLHEVLRQFGLERLSKYPELNHNIQNRKCSYFANWLHNLESDLGGNKHRQVMIEIEADINNIRASWKWALENSLVNELDMAMETLCEFYRYRGMLDEGFDAFYPAALTLGWEGINSQDQLPEHQQMYAETLQILEPATPSDNSDEFRERVLGRLLARYSRFYCESPGRAWKACLVRHDSLLHLSRVGELEEIAWVLRYLGHVWHSVTETKQLYRKALTLFKEQRNKPGIADVLYRLGSICLEAGEYLDAERYLLESLELSKAIGRQAIVLNCLLELGNLSWILGDYSMANEHVAEAMIANVYLGYKAQKAFAKRILARVSIAKGRLADVNSLLNESLAIYERSGLQGLRSEVLSEISQAAFLMGELDEAERRAKESIGICVRVDYHAGRSLPSKILGQVAQEKGNFHRAKEYYHHAFQVALDDQMPAYSLHALEGLARLLAERGDSMRFVDLSNYLIDHPATWCWTKERIFAYKDNMTNSGDLIAGGWEPSSLVGRSLENIQQSVFG
jgi:predicted ATPase/DNA-binding CsgD family transcriptional regulator